MGGAHLVRNSPRVTVIIPTFNRHQWLAGAIQSVLNQTYRDFLLVVADNQSTDSTPLLIEGFDDPRLISIRRPSNVGLVANHNLALQDVTTEYSLILPDDDRIRSNALEKLVATLDANPQAGMAHGRFDIVDSKDTILLANATWMFGSTSGCIEEGSAFIRESMSWGCRVCASTALMRTVALPQSYFRDEDFPAVDLGLWLRMALEWDMAFVGSNLGSYRIHDASHSAAFGTTFSVGYVQNTEIVTRLRELKLAFVNRYERRLENTSSLRRRAKAAFRRELISMTRNLTLPERQLKPTVALLSDAVRREPRLLLERAAWMTLLGSILGRNLTERAKRLLPSRVESPR